jgi:hypothetical protein
MIVGDWSHLDERIENVTDEIEGPGARLGLPE